MSTQRRLTRDSFSGGSDWRDSQTDECGRSPVGHVLNEASEKLHDRDGHRATLTLVGMVLPTKNDALAIEGDQTVIADRDAMGVPTEVPQRAPGPVTDVPRVC
jgi:hypothetical protein